MRLDAAGSSSRRATAPVPSGQTPVVSRIDQPFHADQVRSLLPPPPFHAARARARPRTLAASEGLPAVEDKAVAAAVHKVERAPDSQHHRPQSSRRT